MYTLNAVRSTLDLLPNDYFNRSIGQSVNWSIFLRHSNPIQGPED